MGARHTETPAERNTRGESSPQQTGARDIEEQLSSLRRYLAQLEELLAADTIDHLRQEKDAHEEQQRNGLEMASMCAAMTATDVQWYPSPFPRQAELDDGRISSEIPGQMDEVRRRIAELETALPSA